VAEKCFHLDELVPTEALQVLAIAATETDGKHLDEVTLQVFSGVFGPQVTLLVPDAYAQRGGRRERKARQRTFGAVIGAYEEVRFRTPIRKLVPDNAVPLPKGVAWLLFNSSSSPGEEPAPEAEQEYLVVGHRISSIGRVIEILEDLRFHATHTRVAAAKTKAGTTLYLFHVLDDHERRSTFQSIVASSALPECSILTCFHNQRLSIFFPQGRQPGRQGLTYFCHLLQAAPAIFDIMALNIERGPLAAIDRWPPAGPQLHLLPLAGLRFYSQIDFTPWTANPADFGVHDLADSQVALSRLREAIEAEDPHVGYRLELRSARYREPVEDERKRLREQQAEIEYKLAYLDSIERPRPTLLRFTQRQLPALAEVIRSFPRRVIREGFLKYGFQATDNDAGFHFILVEPQHAVMTELDPLLLWRDLDNRPMRFWLDPYWARYYFGRGNECLVFVPQGTALFPSMHDWDPDSMDEYVRDVLERWFHGHHEVARIPDKPIYVFDGEVRPGAELQIAVLNQANMQPLHTRLGWLNDNLTIMDAVGIEEFVQETADGVTRRALAQTIGKKVHEVEKAFAKRTQELGENIAAKTIWLTEAVTRELVLIVKETEETVEKIKQLDRRLRALQTKRAVMEGLATQAEALVAQNEKKTGEVTSAIAKLEEKVAVTKEKAETSRQKMEGQISAKIASLRSTRERLLRQLHELRREKGEETHAEPGKDCDTTVRRAD